MKPSPVHLLLAIVLACPVVGSAQTARKTQSMRDAASNDQLSQTLRMAQQKDPLRDLGPAAGDVDKDPAKQYAGRDLIKDSTILCYRGYLTLVPKRAVLHLPENLKDRFGVKPNIQVQPWKEFYQANRGWIRTIEVSREQAMGQAPMPEEIVKAFESSTSAVVAVFKGGPISVLPYKDPATAIEGATAAAPNADLTATNPTETVKP